MLAFGDSGAVQQGVPTPEFIGGFGWPGLVGSNHADRRSNGSFCDCHVETSNSDPIHQFQGSGDTYWFKPDAALAKRWNNDNQPHPETWTWE